MDSVTAEKFVPDTADLAALAAAARLCRGCELYRDATQTVFGDGSPSARLMLVGEQPGDREDTQGEPFVGPAGKLLDSALAAARIDRDGLYVTNAVKHFKFVRDDRGVRRIHKSPSRIERVACRPWLWAELHAVQPAAVLLMGATAAQSLLGNGFRLTAHRGEILPLPGNDLSTEPQVVVTVHPSAVLRAGADSRKEAFDGLVADLAFAATCADIPTRSR